MGECCSCDINTSNQKSLDIFEETPGVVRTTKAKTISKTGKSTMNGNKEDAVVDDIMVLIRV